MAVVWGDHMWHRGTTYGTVDSLGAIYGSHTWPRGSPMIAKIAVNGPRGQILGGSLVA